MYARAGNQPIRTGLSLGVPPQMAMPQDNTQRSRQHAHTEYSLADLAAMAWELDAQFAHGGSLPYSCALENSVQALKGLAQGA